MTWTPNDGPSREAIEKWLERVNPHDYMDGCIGGLALAAHDLYEEVQTLKAKPAGQALDEIREVIQLREENKCLKAELALSDEALAACQAEAGGRIRKLEADVAEAKRVIQVASDDMMVVHCACGEPYAGTDPHDILVDYLRRTPPTPAPRDES